MNQQPPPPDSPSPSSQGEASNGSPSLPVSPNDRTGLIRHINRYKQEEWLTPEEVAFRRRQRRTERKESRQKSVSLVLTKIPSLRKMKLPSLIAVICLFFLFLLMSGIVWRGMSNNNSYRIGSVYVSTNLDKKDASGASIYIDGEMLVGKCTPFLIPKLPDGVQFIAVEKKGFHANPPVMKVRVHSGSTAQASFVLECTPLLGELSVSSTHAVPFNLFVDGIRTTFVPNQPIQIPVGMHTIAAFKDGHAAEPPFQRVLIDPKSPRAINFSFVPLRATGKLQAFGTPDAHAQVYLDGVTTGVMANGEAIPLTCGKHEVEVVGDIRSASNVAPTNIDIRPGMEHGENFRTEPAVDRLPFNIETSKPGANIILDGKWLPYLTPWSTELPPGRHYVNFYRDGKWFSANDRLFAVGPDKANKLTVDF